MDSWRAKTHKNSSLTDNHWTVGPVSAPSFVLVEAMTMFTAKQCRERATQKIAQAERDPHRRKLLNAAASWLALARVTEEADVVLRAARKRQTHQHQVVIP